MLRRLGLAALALLIVVPPALVAGAHVAGWQPLVERTGSMAPMIEPGNLLVVSHVRAAALHRGEVITFGDPFAHGRTLTHRVMSVRPAAGGRLAIVTRGDANRGSESWMIGADGTVGRLRAVVAVPPAVTRLTQDTPVRGVLLALFALLATVSTLRAIWRRPSPRCDVAS